MLVCGGDDLLLPVGGVHGSHILGRQKECPELCIPIYGICCLSMLRAMIGLRVWRKWIFGDGWGSVQVGVRVILVGGLAMGGSREVGTEVSGRIVLGVGRPFSSWSLWVPRVMYVVGGSV